MDTVDAYAFYRCSKLVIVDMGSSVRVIGDGTFSGCSKIKANLPAELRPAGRLLRL